MNTSRIKNVKKFIRTLNCSSIWWKREMKKTLWGEVTDVQVAGAILIAEKFAYFRFYYSKILKKVKSICYSSCSLNVLLHFFYCGWKCVQLIIQLLIPNCYYFRWLICLTFTVEPSITCWTSKNWLISHPILHNAFTHMTQHSAASTCSNQSLSQSKWKSHHFLFLLWLSIYCLELSFTRRKHYWTNLW